MEENSTDWQYSIKKRIDFIMSGLEVIKRSPKMDFNIGNVKVLKEDIHQCVPNYARNATKEVPYSSRTLPLEEMEPLRKI